MLPPKPRVVVVCCATLIAATAGCSETAESEREIEPEVVLSPFDGTTNVKGETPKAWLHQSYSTDPGTLQTLKKRMSLVTWPDQKRVTVDKTVENLDGEPVDSVQHHVTLSPTSSLKKEGYALLVQSLPSGLSWGNGVNDYTTNSGAVAARFWTESKPMVTHISVAKKWKIPEHHDVAKKTKVHKVEVRLSEPVDVAKQKQPKDVAAVSQQTDPACEMHSHEKTGGELLAFTCDSLTLSSKLTVEIEPNALKSETGKVMPANKFAFVPRQHRHREGTWTFQPSSYVN